MTFPDQWVHCGVCHTVHNTKYTACTQLHSWTKLGGWNTRRGATEYARLEKLPIWEDKVNE